MGFDAKLSGFLSGHKQEKDLSKHCMQRPLEQRRTSGGKGTEYRLPKCGDVFLDQSYFPQRCKCRIGPARQSRKEVSARHKIQ
jgi:hypothetical protein